VISFVWGNIFYWFFSVAFYLIQLNNGYCEGDGVGSATSQLMERIKSARSNRHLLCTCT